VWDLT